MHALAVFIDTYLQSYDDSDTNFKTGANCGHQKTEFSVILFNFDCF